MQTGVTLEVNKEGAAGVGYDSLLWKVQDYCGPVPRVGELLQAAPWNYSPTTVERLVVKSVSWDLAGYSEAGGPEWTVTVLLAVVP